MLKKNEINEIISYVKKAGLIALKEQDKLTIEEKSDSTIVTNGDLKVSEYLEKKLSKFYPVLSEENYNQKLIKNNNTLFVIDPIDGTVSYSKKEDTWVSIITLVHKNKPIFAIVYQASKDKLFIAEKGKGARLFKGKSSKNLTTSKNKNEKIIVSPNYKEEDLHLIKNFQNKSIIKEFGASLKIMNIIEGKADFYPISDRWFGVWDLIGASLILEEAGGSFTFLDGYKWNLNDKKINHPFIASSK